MSFIKAQYPLNGERTDNKCPTTTIKTFQALGLEPQAPKKEKETKKKKKAVVESMMPSTKKSKTKPSDEGKRKGKQEKKEASLLSQKRGGVREGC